MSIAQLLHEPAQLKPLRVGRGGKRRKRRLAQLNALKASGTPMSKVIYSDYGFSQTLPPTKRQIKALIRRNRWDVLGKAFGFVPEYMATAGGKKIIDWRCVPEPMAAILRQRLIEPIRRTPRPPQPKTQRDRSARPRQALFVIQNGLCHYCKQPTPFEKWTIDHKTPLCRGGSNHFTNKVGACRTCNHAKSAMTEAEFRSVPPGERKEFVKAILNPIHPQKSARPR